MFNVHIQSTPVSGTLTGLRQILSPEKEKRGGGGGSKGGPPALAGTRKYEQSRPESVAGGGAIGCQTMFTYKDGSQRLVHKGDTDLHCHRCSAICCLPVCRS